MKTLLITFLLMALFELAIFFIALLWISRFKVQDMRILKVRQLQPIKYKEGVFVPIPFKVTVMEIDKNGREQKNVLYITLSSREKYNEMCSLWDISMRCRATLKEIQQGE